MKIVKYIFLLLLLASIAVTVFIATQEGKYDIHKERVIKVRKDVLYNYINDYRNWENVGIITDADSTAAYSYSEKTGGTGASMEWKKGDVEGKITTLKLKENDSIQQKAVIDGLTSEITWGFDDTAAGTKVSVRLQGQLTFSEKAAAVLSGGVEEKFESALDKGLGNLNTFLIHELSTYNVEVKGVVNKTGSFYIGQRATTDTKAAQAKVSELLPKLQAFIKENKITPAGSPFTLYDRNDSGANKVSFIVCIPIKDEIFTTPGSDIIGGKLATFKALKTTLTGDHSHLPKAWEAGFKHLSGKMLQENTTGQYMEIYTKNVKHTKKPSGWITDIYIPIGAPAVTPVTEEAQPVVQQSAAPKPSSSAVPATVKPASTTAQPRQVNKPSTAPQGSKPAATTNATPRTQASGTTPKPAAQKPQQNP